MDLANLLYGTDMTCNFYWKLQYANTMNGLQCPKIDIHGTSLPSTCCCAQNCNTLRQQQQELHGKCLFIKISSPSSRVGPRCLAAAARGAHFVYAATLKL